ncbi:MAG: YibE/F family protein [bacterium]|nr:YibE/F family protein [bacterium]
MGEVVTVETVLQKTQSSSFSSTEKIYIQNLTIQYLNTNKKGTTIELDSQYTETLSSDEFYRVSDQVFLSKEGNDRITITGIKRDWVFFIILGLFISLVILIGRQKGTLALLSISINILLSIIMIQLLIYITNPYVIGFVFCLLFTGVSFLCIHGLSKQCKAGFLSTLISLLIAFTLSFTVIGLFPKSSYPFHTMEYLTYIHPSTIFLIEIMIGGLGAIIDIANTMTTAVRELHLQDSSLSFSSLWKKGMTVGRDIMGTMVNVLFFVFLGGSIPNIILWICNDVKVDQLLQYYLSLEITRTLTSGICIVLSIPISLFVGICIEKGVHPCRSILR